MEQRKKRIGLLGFVGSILLVAVLAALASSTWATPAQLEGDGSDTIPDKFCDDPLVARGQSTEIRILMHCPITDTWINTVVTDTVDANLDITGLGTTKGSASWTGQNVTFTIGTMAPGSSVTLSIYVRVNDDAPEGYDVENIAYMKHVGWRTVGSDEEGGQVWMFRVAYAQYIPLWIRRYQ
jgi:hypothetical protein